MSEQTEQEMNQAIGPDVDIQGAYPSGQVSDRRDADKPAPTKETREAGSLGDLTREVSTSTMAENSGGLGSPVPDDEERQSSDSVRRRLGLQ